MTHASENFSLCITRFGPGVSTGETGTGAGCFLSFWTQGRKDDWCFILVQDSGTNDIVTSVILTLALTVTAFPARVQSMCHRQTGPRTDIPPHRQTNKNARDGV
ncbi:hypothetical protein ElyMa_001009900 [Elysia marginata]|uniref:Uncharacterized protein n=1 Tax=Elysia marginata TaxID=1093978 RepID=A0AAV4HL30_9GAST|nr:hypothetical protein ElyMa_001009900 [Elysia marginata]